MKQLIKRPLLRMLSLMGRKIGSRFDKNIQKNRINNILVFCDGGIGDILRIFPVIKTLIAEFPSAIFYILTNSTGAGLFELYPSHSFKLIMFDVRRVHRSFIAKIKLLRFLKNTLSLDLVYNPHYGQGMTEHAFMSYLTGAPFRIGFNWEGTGFLYTNKAEFDQCKPILQQNISLLSAIGIDSVPNCTISVRIPSEDLTFARNFLRKHNAHGHTIIAIHPFADWESRLRSWPLEHYASLVREICKHFAVKVLILGTKRERIMNEHIFQGIDGSSLISTLEETSIAQMAALLSYSHVFIGNDSGPLHLALALNVPSIALFGATSPQQVIGTESDNCATITKKLPCSPCYLHQPFFRPRCKNVECLSSITVSEVLDVVAKKLSFILRNESILPSKNLSSTGIQAS